MAGLNKPCLIFAAPAWVYPGVHILSKLHGTAVFLFIFTQRRELMGEKCDWPCWEIMGCEKSKKCPAKVRPDTPCWEIAREMSALSKHEIQSIMVSKANCVLTSEEYLVNY